MSKGTWWRPSKHSYVKNYDRIDWASGRVAEAKELMEMIKTAKESMRCDAASDAAGADKGG